jgi:hypothetical protein
MENKSLAFAIEAIRKEERKRVIQLLRDWLREDTAAYTFKEVADLLEVEFWGWEEEVGA